ncbi:MAG: antitoxin family protein [bacterium]
MSTILKARYSEGIIKPLEPVWFEEGKELVVTIEEEASRGAKQRFEQSAGSWRGLIDEGFLDEIYIARMLSQKEITI